MSESPSEKYKLIRVIGSGSFSNVWKAVLKEDSKGTVVKYGDNNNENTFAVKVTHIKSTSNEGYVKTEPMIMERLGHHENIVKIYEHFIHKSSMWLIMELVEDSIDLFSLVEKSVTGMNTEELRPLFKQVLCAISYAHYKRFIVHRDIKLENILVYNCKSVRDNGDVDIEKKIKVIDWGLSTVLEKDDVFTFGSATAFAPLDTFVGTVEYCAPEVIARDPYDGIKADCWSLGVTLYIALTGSYPWKSRDDFLDPENYSEAIQHTFRCILNMDMYPIPERVTDTNAISLCESLMCFNIDSRYDTRKALLHPWMKDA